MAIQRDTPYSGMNFSVDLGDGQEDGTGTGLLEVGLPHAALTVLKYRNGNDRDNAVKKLQTTTQYSNLVLKRGALGALNWYAWWNAMRNGEQGIQRNITVRLLSEDHGDVVMVWKFRNARPVNYHFSPLNALGTEALVETLELAVERMEME